MLTPEIKHFATGLAKLGLPESEQAVSLIWYLQHVEGAEAVSAIKVAKLMHDLSLRGQVNASRLATKLAKHWALIRGSKAGTFKIRLEKMSELSEEHEPLLQTPKPKVEPHVVSQDELTGTRKYLVVMAEQINGCYQFGFYDGCAVMCRRLMETLLIEVFEHHKSGAAIKNANGEYLGLGDIIAKVRAGQHFKLQRGTADVMDAIKLLGDTAAHSRTYITKQQDIDDQRFKFRKVISELLHLAGMA